MPTDLHETLIDLFRREPHLVLDLLGPPERLGLGKLRVGAVEPADLTRPRPRTLLPDLAISFCNERGQKVQLARDEAKRRSWPMYIARGHALWGLPTTVLVVTPDRSVARWAAQPIALGPGCEVRVTVLGPAQIPRVTSERQAHAHVELAVLSALAHGNEPDGLSVLMPTFRAVDHLEHGLSILYTDTILGVLNDALREELHRMLVVDGYEIKSPFFLELIEAWKQQGLEAGRAEVLRQGRDEATLSALIAVITARIGAPDEATLTRLGAADTDTLQRWLVRAAVADTLDEVFDAP